MSRDAHRRRGDDPAPEKIVNKDDGTPNSTPTADSLDGLAVARSSLSLAAGERDNLGPLIDLAGQRPDLAKDLLARMAHRAMREHVVDQLGAILISAEAGQRLDALAGRLRRLAETCDEAHATARRMEARAFAARKGVAA